MAENGLVFKASIIINRPAADIWAFMCEFQNDALWRSGVQSVDLTSDEPLRLGSTGIHYMRMGGALHWRVTTWEVNTVMGWEFSGGYLRGSHGAYHLAPIDGGTQVTIDGWVSGGLLLTALLRLGKSLVMRTLERDLSTLKRLLEQDRQPMTGPAPE